MKKLTNTGQRIISVILTVMMLLSVLPTAAFAAEGDVAQIGETTYIDLVTALDEASKSENEGCTVKLLNNTTLSDTYEIRSGSFTLDLNGKKIEKERNDLFQMYGGDITIIDTVGGGSLIAGYQALDYLSGGHITLGKADGTANNFTVQGGYRSLYGSPSSVTIYGGTYIAGSEASIKFYIGYISESLLEGLAFVKKDDPTSVVNGNVGIFTESVTVVSAPDSANVAQIGNTKYTKLETALDEASKAENVGCTLTLLADVKLSNPYDVVSKFTLDLNGKKIEHESDTVFYVTNGGDLTVIDSVGGGSLISYYHYALRYWYSIYGGHITLGKADGTANNFTVQGGNCSLYGSPSSVTIYGGTYIAGSQASIKFSTGCIFEALGDNLAFAKKDDTSTLVDSSVSTLTESVTVVSHTHSYDSDRTCACGATDPSVAQIGDTTYTDLTAALDEASKSENAGCTVKLLADVVLENYYSINCTEFTLDLNGKKIGVKREDLFHTFSGDITIIDTVGGGSLIAETDTLYYRSGGHITLGKADGTANNFTVQGGYRSLYGSPSSVTIYGGTYIAGSKASINFSSGYISEALGEGYILLKKDDTTSVVDGNVSILTESVTVKTAPDVAQIGETKYNDLVTALDEASKSENEGCTVKLLGNVTLDDTYGIAGGKFTFDLNGKKIEYDNWIFFITGGDVTIIDSVGGGSIISSSFALGAEGGHLTLGKADGTENNFTIQGEGCSLYCITKSVTIYGGTYIAGSLASIWEDSQLYTNGVLGDGLAFAKKDDPTSIVNGNVSQLYESVTVVKHTHSYVDGECACGATAANSVVSADFDKPILGGFNQYYFTVEGRPSKLQIAHSDGSTYTFNRYSSMSVNGSRGVVSIKSYDANGNEVDSLSRLVAYEVWTINLNLSEDDYTVRAKFEDEWEKNTKNFSVKFDLTHGEVAVTEFTKADGAYLFKTNGTAQKLRIVSADGATRTYDRSNSNVTITAYNVDGTEVEIGSENVAYEIWSVATTLADGSYTAITKYYDGGAYHWSETGFSFECNSSEN